MSRTFESLTVANYRLWFAGALVSNVGTWMQRIAQDWLVLTVLTHDSGVAIGITTGLQFLPFLLLSPFTGVLADRLDHRRLLIATQVVAGALSIGLGVIVVLDAAQLWHVYAFALALGIVAAFDSPARQTIAGDLVPKAKLANAVALNSASFNAARLVGPGVAGLLIGWLGPGWVIIANGMTFGATIIALVAMKTENFHHQERAPRSPGQILDGMRYMRGRRDLVVISVVVGVASAFALNFQMTAAMMARIAFDEGPEIYGVLGTILAIGSLSGALLAARRRNPSARLVVKSAAAMGVSMIAMALAPGVWWYAAASIPVGFFALTMLTAANAAMQTTTPAPMRGRVMSLYMMVFMGATPIGAPFVGWVGEALSPRIALGLGSFACLAVVAAVLTRAVVRGRLDVALSAHRPFVKVTTTEVIYPPV